MSRPAPMQLPRSRVAIAAPPIAQRAPQAENNGSAAAAPFALDALRVGPRPQRSATTEVGPADDVHEREADAIARTVMRMPADVELQEAPESVQRACAACEAEDKVQRLSVEEAEREHGPPDLAAAPGQLTSGGAPLGAGLRGFYESRLGRDLSGVRIHQGGAAEAMADSISARAFTYGSHIWLGRGESAAPSETLSHEMAHVLQQTQPASLGDDAAEAGAAAPAAQRAARWVPQPPAAGEQDFEKSRGGAHNAVIEEVSRDPGNANLLAEVPIPNAGKPRKDGRPSFGFADFFKSNPALTLPGIIVAKDPAAKPSEEEEQPTEEDALGETEPAKADDVPAPPPAETPIAKPHVPASADRQVENFDAADWRPGWLNEWLANNPCKSPGLAQPMKGGTAFEFSGHQHPRVEDGKVVGVPKAPTTIALGELKPGHNAGCVEKALREQLPRYEKGLTKAKDAVNAVDPKKRDGTWALKFDSIRHQGDGLTGLRIPAGLHPRAKNPTFRRKLKLKINNKLAPTEVTGHLAFGPHPSPRLAGVWIYAFVPANAPSAGTLTAGQSASFKQQEKELRKMIALLKKTPTKVAKRRPAVTARRATRRVIRRDRKERADSFDRQAWEPRREAFAKTFKEWKAKNPEALETIEQQAALREAQKALAEEIKGVAQPNASAKELADSKLLRRMERMADPKFGPLLGVLREKFGTVFVRLATAYDGFREKLHERMKGAPGDAPAGNFSTWQKKAIKLLIKAATVGAGLLMKQVVHNFAICIDSLADQVVAKFEGELEENFGEEMDRIIKAFDALRARIEAELEPFLGKLDALFAMLADVEKLTSLIGDMVTAARLVLQVASCLSPPLAGCLWGLVAQLGIEGALHIAVDQDWFKQAVINPIARTLIEPFADDAYKLILQALLGDPNTKTLRGTLADMVAKTPNCAVPKRAQMLASSGSASELPTMTPQAAGQAARGTAETWHEKYAAEIDAAVKRHIVNANGSPASDEQVAILLDAVERSGLGAEALRKAAAGAAKGGRLDAERLRATLARGGQNAPPAPAGPAAEAGDAASAGVTDMTRATEAMQGKSFRVPLYGQLRTPPAQRASGSPAVLDLYFPRGDKPLWRFLGQTVTFLETYREADEAGTEQDWLRFSLTEVIRLNADNSQVTLGAGEHRIMLVGEAAP